MESQQLEFPSAWPVQTVYNIKWNTKGFKVKDTSKSLQSSKKIRINDQATIQDKTFWADLSLQEWLTLSTLFSVIYCPVMVLCLYIYPITWKTILVVVLFHLVVMTFSICFVFCQDFVCVGPFQATSNNPVNKM